jgi:hypothetical protein
MLRRISHPRRSVPWRLRGRLVFVSYRRRESAYATGWLCDKLVDCFGQARVIQDVRSIPAGVDFRDYIETVIPHCMVVIAVIGPEWKVHRLSDGRRYLEEPLDTVGLEIGAALRQDIRVIPVLVDGAKMPDAAALPPELIKLAGLHALPLRPHPDFSQDVGRLISQMSRPHCSLR